VVLIGNLLRSAARSGAVIRRCCLACRVTAVRRYRIQAGPDDLAADVTTDGAIVQLRLDRIMRFAGDRLMSGRCIGPADRELEPCHVVPDLWNQIERKSYWGRPNLRAVAQKNDLTRERRVFDEVRPLAERFKLGILQLRRRLRVEKHRREDRGQRKRRTHETVGHSDDTNLKRRDRRHANILRRSR
jgi:hypothetical protein